MSADPTCVTTRTLKAIARSAFKGGSSYIQLVCAEVSPVVLEDTPHIGIENAIANYFQNRQIRFDKLHQEMSTTLERNVPISPPEQDPHPQRKWYEYFGFSTDHKVIGIQYLVTAFFFYFVGGALAEVMRTELSTPDPRFCPARIFIISF